MTRDTSDESGRWLASCAAAAVGRVDGGGAKTGRAEELVAEVGDAARDAEVRVDDGACNRQEALPQE